MEKELWEDCRRKSKKEINVVQECRFVSNDLGNTVELKIKRN